MRTEKKYSLSRSQHILREAIKRFKRLKKRLSEEDLQYLESHIEALDLALLEKDQDKTRVHAQSLETFLKTSGKKTIFEHVLELILALILAISIAACVRQMWFELYEIPTGSMRPTFREKDKVLVMKNAFGINTPFHTSHLMFDPELIQRGQIIVFSGDGLDIPDVDTVYFGLFPGKKRYVKRCLGKPGDSYYFYGGKIYVLDKDNNLLCEFASPNELQDLAHIPFISFDGKTTTQFSNHRRTQKITIRYMDIPVASIFASEYGPRESKILFKGQDSVTPDAFSQILGIENFAQARLISPKNLPIEAKNLQVSQNADLYLELKHHPTITQHPKSSSTTDLSLLDSSTTWIPLTSHDIDRIKNVLTTSRFIVNNGTAYRYSYQEVTSAHNNGVRVRSNIPNGTYEFIDGTAYHIGFLGISTALPRSHPIYPTTDTDIQVFFNSGIELTPITNPQKERDPYIYPSRYAYFREGDFFVMDQPLFARNNPKLIEYIQFEKKRALHNMKYTPFIDKGAPSKSDILKYGMKIPEKQYLALGDNHAMSGDSRFFGYIPEQNIQGSPLLIFWPFGERFGLLPQPQTSFFRIENLYTGAMALLFMSLTYWYYKTSTSRKRYYRIKNK